LRGVKTPRKKPPSSSDGSGGKDWSKASPEERIEHGLANLRKK